MSYIHVADLSCQTGVHGCAAWRCFHEPSVSAVGETRFGLEVLENIGLTLDVQETKEKRFFGEA